MADVSVSSDLRKKRKISDVDEDKEDGKNVFLSLNQYLPTSTDWYSDHAFYFTLWPGICNIAQT